MPPFFSRSGVQLSGTLYRNIQLHAYSLFLNPIQEISALAFGIDRSIAQPAAVFDLSPLARAACGPAERSRLVKHKEENPLCSASLS